MKTITLLLILLLAGTSAIARNTNTEPLACDCPECREKAASGNTGFSLPGLEGLNADKESHDHETDPHDHTDQEHVDEEHDDHEHHQHDHEEHDDQAAGAVDIHEEMAKAVGIQVYQAEGGTIAKTSVFPAEIKLNRDRKAAVSPRYASVVRQVFAEIGDEVKKGDVLASLENRETLAVYTVAAPLDGVVIAKDLAVGETADANTVIYEVADLSSVWADVSIFPQYQHLIQKGMGVEFIAHDGHKAHGRVMYISPIISHETRTFTARCVLKEADVDFTPGAFVRARIAMETAHVDVRIERTALQSVDGETAVFVPTDHGYEPVIVTTGVADANFVEIVRGLKEGDRYVAVGAFTLKAELITSGMDPHAGHSH